MAQKKEKVFTAIERSILTSLNLGRKFSELMS